MLLLVNVINLTSDFPSILYKSDSNFKVYIYDLKKKCNKQDKNHKELK